MSFIGRKKELSFLKSRYNSEGSSITVLYGHKGVGKTALCRKFSQGLPSCFLFARECADLWQRMFFAADAGLRSSSGKDCSYAEIFDAALKARGRQGEKFVLVIDEFQDALRVSDSFMTELIDFVNKSESQVMCLLISSSVSFVENDLVPSIGRSAVSIDTFYKLPELGFLDCVKYFSRYSTGDCIKVYSILGGYPAYWKCFSDEMSPEENIKKNILDPSSFMYSEGRSIVAFELRELGVYSTVLHCLAGGLDKLNDIHQSTGYSRAKISVYLKNLMEMELVEKVFSFEGANNANAKKGIYRITVPYLRFFMLFLYENKGMLEMVSADEFYDAAVRKEIESFYLTGIKKVCAEYLSILNESGALVINAVRSGEWQGKSGNIDIILQDENGKNILGFCPVSMKDAGVQEYTSCLKTIRASGLSADEIYIFSAAGFSDELKAMSISEGNIKLVSLEDL